MLGDIRSPALLYVKGGLFLVAGLLSAAAVVLEHPTWKVAGLLLVAIWCLCRAYYFGFYVVSHYADPSHRFAGLTSFVWYMLRRRKPK